MIDFAAHGEIMAWDDDLGKFESCLEKKKDFNEFDIKKIMRDCVIGLDFLHKNGVVHRDIKPLNIMLDEYGNTKFADFGASVILDEREDGDNFTDTQGTYHFLSPECCDPAVKIYSGKKADIWALGITLYCLFYSQLPFGGD